MLYNVFRQNRKTGRIKAMSTPKQRNQSILYMSLCALLWSTAGIFIKVIPWNPLIIAGLRSLIGAIVFILYMRSSGIKFVINRPALYGGVFLAGTFIFFVAANKLTTAANAIVLQFTAPIFILILSALIFHQKFRKGDIITVIMTYIGISLFFIDKLSSGYLAGNILALIAGLFLASMFIASGRADTGSRMSGILIGHIITAAIGVPMIFFFPISPSPVSILSIAGLGILQIGIPYILYGLAAKHCAPLACSLIGAIEPLLNPVWVFIFDGERPGFYALIGGAAVILTIMAWCIWSGKTEGESKNVL